jgi:hypothetical protein
MAPLSDSDSLFSDALAFVPTTAIAIPRLIDCYKPICLDEDQGILICTIKMKKIEYNGIS